MSSETGYRTVIVVSPSTASMHAFRDSGPGRALEAQQDVQVQTIMITENNSAAERARRTLNAYASTQGTVTFITRALGRGTDFHYKDQKVLDN